jgi:hypothetical protein
LRNAVPALTAIAAALVVLWADQNGMAAGRKIVLTNTYHGLKPGVSTANDVTAALGKPDREASGVTYGSVEGLRLLTYDKLVVSAFLREDRLFLLALAPKPGSDFPNEMIGWEAALGKAERWLPSIRGKNHRVYVYSAQGLTATADNGRVSLVEIFAPMPEDDYEKTIYKTPPVFIK